MAQSLCGSRKDVAVAVDNSYTVDVVDFNWVQLVLKDSCTWRFLCFNDALDLLDFIFVPANDSKTLSISSVSCDSNATLVILVARHSHLTLDELAKGR